MPKEAYIVGSAWRKKKETPFNDPSRLLPQLPLPAQPPSQLPSLDPSPDKVDGLTLKDKLILVHQVDMRVVPVWAKNVGNVKGNNRKLFHLYRNNNVATSNCV